MKRMVQPCLLIVLCLFIFCSGIVTGIGGMLIAWPDTRALEEHAFYLGGAAICLQLTHGQHDAFCKQLLQLDYDLNLHGNLLWGDTIDWPDAKPDGLPPGKRANHPSGA